MQQIQLRSAVWHGDLPITLSFPEEWHIVSVPGENSSPLTTEEVRTKLWNPIQSKKISEGACGKKNVVILIDDSTRPTPYERLIPLVITELEEARVSHEAITIIVATGTHAPISHEAIIKKVGSAIASTICVISHDCHGELVEVGKLSRGTPLLVNKTVMDAEYIIGIGGIYPHPSAGFSGGAKIGMPGVCGYETARYLHDYVRGASKRAGSCANDFRREVEEGAAKIGINFMINTVLTDEKEIGALFAGDVQATFDRAVAYVRTAQAVPEVDNADIIISDAYPFDLNLNFVRDRALWPLYNRKKTVSKVVIGACSEGIGMHELFPTQNSIGARIRRRLANFSLGELKGFHRKIISLKKILVRTHLPFILLSQGIKQDELTRCFPRARVYTEWERVIEELERRHGKERCTVALYRCAPLHYSK